jgi:hypothetical protein
MNKPLLQLNVASLANLGLSPSEYAPRYEQATMDGTWLGSGPNSEGWISKAVYSGQVVGRVGIRDALNGMLVALTDRDEPYTNRHMTGLMREGRALEQSDFNVRSIPSIPEGRLGMIAAKLATDKNRRDRKPRG